MFRSGPKSPCTIATPTMATKDAPAHTSAKEANTDPASIAEPRANNIKPNDDNTHANKSKIVTYVNRSTIVKINRVIDLDESWCVGCPDDCEVCTETDRRHPMRYNDAGAYRRWALWE